MAKRRQPKPLLTRLLLFADILLFVFLSWSFYLLFTQGSGPLTFLTSSSSVNLIVDDAGGGVVVTQTPGQERKGGGTVVNTKTGKRTRVKNTKDLNNAVQQQQTVNTNSANCSSGQTQCLDGNTLQVCSSGIWNKSACLHGCAANKCNSPPPIPPTSPEEEALPKESCAPKGWLNENDHKCYLPGEKIPNSNMVVCAGKDVNPNARLPYAYNATSCPQAPTQEPETRTEKQEEDKQPSTDAAPPQPPLVQPADPATVGSPYDCIQRGGTWDSSTSKCNEKPKVPLTCSYAKKCSNDILQTCSITSQGTLKFTSSSCEYGCENNLSCKSTPDKTTNSEFVDPRVVCDQKGEGWSWLEQAHQCVPYAIPSNPGSPTDSEEGETTEEPLVIPTNIDPMLPGNEGILGNTTAAIAKILEKCQRAGSQAGKALSECFCQSTNCEPGSIGYNIADSILDHSTDQLGFQCLEFASNIVASVLVSSPICGTDRASTIDKRCLPREESTGWYFCEKPQTLNIDDIVVFDGSEGHIGICSSGNNSPTCNLGDMNYRNDQTAALHPVAASTVKGVFRRLPPGDPRLKGCWASQTKRIL